LDNAVAKIHELISLDMGSLVEKDKGRERVSQHIFTYSEAERPLNVFSAKMARGKTSRGFRIDSELQYQGKGRGPFRQLISITI
jgi:hypothetical protein